MYDVDDWAEIRRLHFAENLGVKTIARRLGMSKNTVRAAVRSERPPAYERPRKGSLVDAFEPRICELLKGCPSMPATVIAERLEWPHGMTILKERVAELRPLFLRSDPSQRTSYRPGELAQFDLWQPAVSIPLGHDQEERLWVVTAVSAWSRFMVASMVRSRAAHDVLWGTRRCLEQLGGVPRTLVWDNEGCIGAWRRGKEVLTAEFQAFRGTLGAGARLCRPRDPEAKGVNERGNGYYETSFLPGRSFEDVADFNSQLQFWLIKANRRVHATTRKVPAEQIYEDRGAMLSFPPLMPDPSFTYRTRLGRDFFVRVDTNDYSVNPRFIGRFVEVRADLESVLVTADGLELARHGRCYARHETHLDASHARILRQIREEQAEAPKLETEVEERDLSVYDHVLGVA